MSVTENTSPAALRAAARDGEAGSRWSVRWAWFGGADASVLRYVPSELSFLSSLGTTIVALAFLSGFVVSVAVSSWWDTPLYRVLWVGAAWTVLFALIERLVQKSFSTKWLWNAVIIIPRAALSVAMALVFAVPMSQLIFSKSINAELTSTIAAETRAATSAATSFYQPRIASATAQITALRAHEAALQAQVSKYTLASGCEANETSCSHTHKTGCGNWCHFYASKAAAARSQLAALKAQDVVTIGKLRQSLARWRAAETKEISTRTSSIGANRDMLARAEALQRVEKAHHEVGIYVLFLLVFFCCLDLVPLTMKVTHLISTGGVYEKVSAALRERDAVHAHQIQEEALVLRRRISGEARAEEAVDQVEIDVDRERRILTENAKLDRARRGGTKPASEPGV